MTSSVFASPHRFGPSHLFLRHLARVICLGLLSLTLSGHVGAQQAVPTPWQSESESLRRLEPPADPPAAAPSPAAPWPAVSSPGGPSTGAAATPKPEPAGSTVALSAYLTQDGEPIDQGLIWRVYTEKPDVDPPQPRLVSTSKEASPSVALAPGSYVINVAFGRAHLTRRVSVAVGKTSEERFILNAGGLRVTAVLGEVEKVPDLAVSYDVYQGDADRLAGRTKVVGGLRPGLIVRLNAGLYHLVSTMGDANAVVSADVTVEAGKLTDAVIRHYAARVTLRLVTRAGGEAQADTLWAVHAAGGDLVRESQGALPTHILAAGDYVASARHAGRLYQKQFTVVAGQPTQVEVVMR
ncbi:MAG: hypothetical protein AB7L90_15190 [Hyphomicrobiaceae bacterium]